MRKINILIAVSLFALILVANAQEGRLLRSAGNPIVGPGMLEADSDSVLGYTTLEDLEFFWTIPNRFSDKYYNVWFESPYENFSLVEAHIPLFAWVEEGDTISRIGEPGLRVIIWQSQVLDSVPGFPDDSITSLDIPFKDLRFTRYGEDMVVNVIDLRPLEISIHGDVDFNIGVDVIQNDETEQVDTLEILSDFIDGADHSRLWDGRREDWVRTKDIPIETDTDEEVYIAFNFGIWAVVVNDDPEPFISDDNTVALWHLDEGEGDTVSDLSGDFDLFLNQEAGWTEDGMFGTALDLTDDGSAVNSNVIIGTGWEAITVEAWIKPDILFDEGIQPIVSRYERHESGAFSFCVLNQGGLTGRIYTTDGYAEATSAEGFIEEGEWYLVSLTWSEYGLKLWIDGEMVAITASPGGTMRASPDRLTVGYHRIDEDYFYGYIDEIRISIGDRYCGVFDTDDQNALPQACRLYQNFPNPFNPTTTVGFNLMRGNHVKLNIFDIKGRLVKEALNSYHSAGYHTVEIDASDLTTGVYIYRLSAGEFTSTNKMLLVK